MKGFSHEITKAAFAALPKGFYSLLPPSRIKELRLGNIQNEYNFLQRSQWFKLKDIEKLQLKKLKAIVFHAYTHIPYYRRKFKASGITPNDINSLSDITKIPILTKKEIRRNIKNLISPNCQFNFASVTSGSTGKPLKVLLDGESLNWREARTQRAYTWTGFDPGTDRIMNMLNSISYLSTKSLDILSAGIKNLIKNKLIWFPKTFSAKDLMEIFFAMQKFEPKLLNASPSLMKPLLDIKERFDLEFPKSLDYVSICGEAFPIKLIQSKIGAEVFESYATNEVGHVASECKEHSGMHVNMEDFLLEITKNNDVLNNMERGEVVITDFTNYDMPLIRYNLEDISEIENGKCSCGRGLIRLREVAGRKNDFLVSSGSEIVLSDLREVFGLFTLHGEDFIKGVDQFRVIQEKIDRVTVLIVPTQDFSSHTESLIVTRIKKLLGSDVEVKIKTVDKIPSGKKFKYVVSKLGKNYIKNNFG